MNDEQAVHEQVEKLRRWLRSYARAEREPTGASFDESDLNQLETAVEALSVSEDDLHAHLDALRRNTVRLAAERARYQELLDLAPDAYLLTDLEGTVLDANAAAADLLSVQRDVLIGRPLSFFIWPEDKPIYWEWLAELETAERILQWELRCNSAEVQRHVVIRARRAADGRELRWMLRDVTERIQAAETDRRLRQEHAEREENARLLDEARAASRAKSDFIGFMSHEFRTPLASIVGYADLLDHETAGPLTDAQRKQLNRLREGAWHLAHLVDEILSFSRESLSPPTLDMARVDLHQLGTECIQTVRPSALQCGLELNMNTAADPLIVRTDAGRVRQILINLLGNAVKFTDAGTVEMDIQRTSDGVEVRVRDTGIGIPEDQREIVFEPFRQAHGRRGGGSGLGLAVARQLALRLDGMLEVHSEVGVGTTFTLRLPLGPQT